MIDKDLYYMKMALAEAGRAMDEDEVPIGAVVVSARGAVLGRGHNMTEALNDVTAHAEMQAITAAAETTGGKYLKDCTLYVTVEPCIMCAGAIGWSQLSRVVYGASDPKRGYTTLIEKGTPFHPRAEVKGGVMADECAGLMKRFFEKRR